MRDDECYVPASDFLVSLINEEIPIDESDFGRANLSMLITMTRDADVSNRDWAAMLLGHHGPQTDEVRDALLRAADDENQYVRGEAIQALAERHCPAALELVKRELTRESVCVAVFDAAAELADPSLAPLLRPLAKPSGDGYMDDIAKHALSQCRAAKRAASTHSA